MYDAKKYFLFGVPLQTSSSLHYGLAYTVCLLFKCIWELRNISESPLAMNVGTLSFERMLCDIEKCPLNTIVLILFSQRHVWKLYMEKGMFEEAKEHAMVSLGKTKRVKEYFV